MYLNYYNFTKEPFHITPDPEFIFMSPTHREALATIMYGVEQRKGFILITGEVGVGKTTILRAYLEKVDRKQLKPIYVFNPNISFTSLLKTMCQELGLVVESSDPAEIVHLLHRALINEYSQGCVVALIVDEVQNMPVETLENLRMLSNLETTTNKLIQIVLCGQPEFNAILNRHELRQLKQRIAIRTTIAPLTMAESVAYIQHRLAVAGIENNGIFTRAAMSRIIGQAKGIPRMINILCDNALLSAFGCHLKTVESKIAKEIIADMDGKNTWKQGRTWGVSLSAVAVVVVLLGGWSWYTREHAAIAEVNTQPAKVTAPPPEDIAAVTFKLPSRPADTRPSPETGFPVTKVVKRGDILNRMIEDMYGTSTASRVRMVKQENPHISDINMIREGDKIKFPSDKSSWRKYE